MDGVGAGWSGVDGVWIALKGRIRWGVRFRYGRSAAVWTRRVWGKENRGVVSGESSVEAYVR